MFLAGKVEETPRPLKDVILVSYEIMHKKRSCCGRVVIATLGFDLNVHHPYKPIVEAIKKFKVA